MKIVKKLVATAVLAAMALATAGPAPAEAATCYETTGGCGYEECRRAPSIAPCVALGVIAIAAIVAVAIQSSANSHSHAHCHSS